MRFEPLASNTIKNETVKKLKKITWNKFSKVFIRIPGTLAHKTSRLYTHSSILCQEKFCATRKLVHRILWLHTSSIIYLFISDQLKLVTKFSPNGPKFNDKIASGMFILWNYNCFLENFGWYSRKAKTNNYKKYIFAQTIFFLRFKVRSYNTHVFWKLIYIFPLITTNLSMNTVNFIRWGTFVQLKSVCYI